MLEKSLSELKKVKEMDPKNTFVFHSQVDKINCELGKAVLLPEEEGDVLQSVEAGNGEDKRVVTKWTKMGKARKERKIAKSDKSIAFGKLPTESRLRDETESENEGDAQNEGEGQSKEEDEDGMEIDIATEKLMRSTLSGDVEATTKKALDLEKLNQCNDEVGKESKASIPADEIAVDTEKLDEVVNTISMDVLLESKIPTQPDTTNALESRWFKKLVHPLLTLCKLKLMKRRRVMMMLLYVKCL